MTDTCAQCGKALVPVSGAPDFPNDGPDELQTLTMGCPNDCEKRRRAVGNVRKAQVLAYIKAWTRLLDEAGDSEARTLSGEMKVAGYNVYLCGPASIEVGEGTDG